MDLRAETKALCLRQYRDAAHVGGDAHGWRVMSAVLTTVAPGLVTAAIGDRTVTAAEVGAMLGDIALGRDDAAEQIDADRLTRIRAGLLAVRDAADVPVP